EAIAIDHRLPGSHWSGMSKGPLDLESGDILRPDARLWLEARVVEVESPAVPLWTVELDWPESRLAKVRFRIYSRASAGLFPGQVDRKSANLIGAEARRLLPHHAGSQSLNDILGRAPPDQEQWRDAILRVVVTHGTPLTVQRGAFGRSGRSLLKCQSPVRKVGYRAG